MFLEIFISNVRVLVTFHFPVSPAECLLLCVGTGPAGGTWRGEEACTQAVTGRAKGPKETLLAYLLHRYGESAEVLTACQARSRLIC